MQPRRLAALFVLLALPLGIFLAGIVPLGQAPDEQAHVLRADGLLHGNILGRRGIGISPDGHQIIQAGVTADFALVTVVSSPIRPADPTPVMLHGAGVRAAQAIPWRSKPIFVGLNTIATYMPVFYVPATIGIGVAKAVGLGPYWAYLTARLVNLACFILAGVAALLVARAAQLVLLATLLLPTTLSLAASVNQDGLLIVACVLAVALLTRLPHDASGPTGGTPGRSVYRVAAVLIGLVVMVKPPYLPLVGLLLLPLPNGWWTAWRELRGRLITICLISAVAVGWAWVNIKLVAAPVPRPPYDAGPLYAGTRPAVFSSTDLAAQLHILLAHPTRLISLPLATLASDHTTLRESIAVIGYMNVALPEWIYLVWMVSLVGSLLGSLLCNRQEIMAVRYIEGILLALLTALSLQAVLLSQYLTWTPIGMPWIAGLQGRYLLPLLPMAGLLCTRIALRGGNGLQSALLWLPIAAATADLLVVPRAVVEAFYMG